MTPLELCTAPGSYRWYYLDVSEGEWTAVAIFMVGSLFSSRYSKNHRETPPTAHSAVNFALYRAGRRVAWVLSEYPHATLEGDVLHIGPSSFERLPNGRVTARIIERTPWWQAPVQAELTLEPQCDEVKAVTLVEGLSHQWHPFAVRARGEVNVPSHDVRFSGAGYHDGNSGARVLGTDLAGWTWLRVHRADVTTIEYRPHGTAPWLVEATASSATVKHVELPPLRSTRTGWGLTIPSRLGALSAEPRLLESSPFYARLEAREGDAHALGEAGDFARFHSPLVRWMADFRTHHTGVRHER
jgi:carotenoid 1,2-hydratase